MLETRATPQRFRSLLQVILSLFFLQSSQSLVAHSADLAMTSAESIGITIPPFSGISKSRFGVEFSIESFSDAPNTDPSLSMMSSDGLLSTKSFLKMLSARGVLDTCKSCIYGLFFAM